MNRRSFLRNTGILAIGIGAVSSWVNTAIAAVRPPAFEVKEFAESLNSLFSVSHYEKTDAIQFKTPEIAENGTVVPVTVDYNGKAKRIAIFVEKNPQPLTASFDVPAKGSAYVSTRIKMRESSNIHAVIETADGKIIGRSNEVKVTIGGCGG